MVHHINYCRLHVDSCKQAKFDILIESVSISSFTNCARSQGLVCQEAGLGVGEYPEEGQVHGFQHFGHIFAQV